MRTRATVRLPFILLLVAVLHSTFPILPALATPGSVAAQAVGEVQEPPPIPEVRSYQAPSYPTLPGLALEVETTPESVSVGDTITVRLTVTNRAEHPAEDVVLTLPLPSGIQADTVATQATFTITSLPQPVSEIATPLEFTAPVLPNPADSDQAHSDGDDQLSPRPATPASTEVVPPVLPADSGATLASVPGDPGITSDQVAKLPIAAPPTTNPSDLQWSLPTLAPASVAVLEVTLVLNAPQPDGAVLFEPWATARGLVEPARASGGTLVIDAAHTPISSRVEPGARSSVRSADGRVSIEFPPQAADRALSIRYARLADDADALRARGVPIPERGLFGRPSLDTFTLTATDDAGRDLHQFKEPLTLSVSYTEAQLRARGLREGDLTLAWFDESEKRWQPVPTTIDPVAHTATASIDHFSVWTLSDGSSPSAAFVPSLQGFQVSDFTGAASYQVPMEVPAGPAGIKPNLGLSYSSAASDGTGGMRERWQSSWVGKGWTLDAGGSVARVRSPVGEFWDNFSFSLGGRSYDIVRGEQLSGTAGDMNPTLWSWVAVDEADFLKVRAVDAGGGVIVWVAWTKDGSRYDFTQPLYTDDTTARYIYQWLLMRVTDTHGNRIDYQYTIDTVQNAGKSYQPTYYLSQILWGYDGGMGLDNWGHPVVLGTPRYRVQFQVSSRWASPTASVDTLWEYPAGLQAVVSHEAYRLNGVTVQSWGPAASGYETIRSYALEYYDSTQSVWADLSSGQRVLTLQRVTQVGRDSGVLPWTTFTYRMDMGAWPYNPGWNRLVTVNNGRGGQLQITYGKSFGGSTLNEEANYHRVAQVLRQDTSAQAYSRSAVTTYEYPTAALNEHAYSLKVWYAHYPPYGYGDSRSILAHAERREFRGHAWVRTQDYDGATIGSPRLRMTETFFYQGSAGCTPTVTGGVIDSSTPCYAAMAAQELWKGKPYLVKTYDGNGSLLRQTETAYHYQILPFFGLNDYTGSVGYPRTGLWRQFTPARVIKEGFNEGATTPTLGKTTAFCYQTAYQTGTQYGNLTHTLEYDQLVSINPDIQLTDCDYPSTSIAPVRITRTDYAVKNTSSIYLADRPAQRAVFGASASTQYALTEYFYDGSLVYKWLTDRGRLTLERAYRNVTGATLYSRDTAYDHDVWGNRTVEATYADWGTRTYPSYSTPGNSSTARTTTIVYDSTFHAFPIQATNPLNQVESAGYDYRMGTLTSVTDSNTVSTSATYDEFGRLAKIIRPGDTTALPTTEIWYYDWSATNVPPAPVSRYILKRECTTTYWCRQVSSEYYDGLGNLVQTKQESQQNELFYYVSDTEYDGLGRAKRQSQRREVDQTVSGYSAYAVPSSDPAVMRWTTTFYDGLDRVRQVWQPDTTGSQTDYGISANGLYPQTTQYDANNHKTGWIFDTLGRTRGVYEYAGTSGTGYTLNSTTTYAVNPLDQLTQATDAHNNVTSMTYDALGRKLTMSDPDMGSWGYDYDVHGNLIGQIDANRQFTQFGYDKLNRMTGRLAVDASSVTFHDPFTSKSTTNWTWSAHQTVPFNDAGNSVVRNVGTGNSWTANFNRSSYNLITGEGVQVRLKVDNLNTNAHVSIEADDPTYRRFGVVADSGKLYVQYTVDGTTWVYPADVLANLQINTWYVVQITLDDVSGFQVTAYQESNPSVRGSYRAVMPAGKNWRFHHWNYTGTAYLDDYREVQGTVYRYDEAGVPYGRGHRTSMSGLSNSVYWSFDARGRTTQATHYSWWTPVRAFQWTYDSADRVQTITYPSGEVLTYGYDSAWREQTLASNWFGYLVSNAQYTALDQPKQQVFGNGVTQTWTYNPMARLERLQIGSTFDRSYGYDFAGNIAWIGHAPIGVLEQFTYDHRDRLKTWVFGSINESYDYDPIGNLKLKAGVTQTFGSTGFGTGAGPHQARTVGGQAYTYDLNGNLLSGGGRTYSWDAQNQPLTVTSGGVTENYRYDGDGGRVYRQRGSAAATLYYNGLWEERTDGWWQSLYQFNGKIIGQHDNWSGGTVTYMHGDHLGSVGMSTNASGAVLNQQEFDPWGKIRSGSVPQTKRNYTGQYLDDTGLLYYNARYYDPGIGRFVSADTIVPSAGALTVAPTDATAAALWGKGGAGVANPQELNRYSYVNNNPLKYTDPTGHCVTAETFAACAVVAGEVTSAAFAGLMALPFAAAMLASEIADGRPMTTDASGAPVPMPEEDIPTITIPADQYPEAAKHVEEAQAAGHPDTLTVDRKGAKARRKESLRGIPTVTDKDRDEYPPAVSQEGGSGASVKHIPSSDNRGAGAFVGQKLRTYPNGTRVRLKSSNQLE